VIPPRRVPLSSFDRVRTESINSSSKQVNKHDILMSADPRINGSDTASMIENNAADRTSFSIAFSSGLSSHPSNVVMNMGQYTNQTSFNWSLQVQAA
jgi:hypothetical protein